MLYNCVDPSGESISTYNSNNLNMSISHCTCPWRPVLPCPDTLYKRRCEPHAHLGKLDQPDHWGGASSKILNIVALQPESYIKLS